MPKDASTEPKKKFSFPKIAWKNPVVIAVSLLLVIVIIKVLGTAMFIFQMMSHPRPAPLVTSAKIKNETWPEVFTAVAQLKSENGALLKAEQPGVLREINVQTGQEVKKGDVLLVISGSAERATAKMAELTYERAKELRAQGVNTQSDLDQAEAAYAQAQSDLDKKEIKAPFDGEVGIPQVFVGQYVEVGTPLIAVESRKTIYADFGLPQERISQIEKGAEVTLTMDAFPGESFKGVIEGVDPRVDEATLTVAVRAVFDNKEGKLLSGMFGTVRVSMKENHVGFAMPASAVVYSAYGNTVYVVSSVQDPKTKKETLTVKQALVKVLASQGDWVLVENVGGEAPSDAKKQDVVRLKDGLDVVSSGQMKLRNDSPVRVDNGQALPAEKTPKVQES